MKVRKGFVSNSSSCSFTCFICGKDHEGWDWDEPACCGAEMVMDGSTHLYMLFLSYLSKKYEFDIKKEKKKFIKGVKNEN